MQSDIARPVQFFRISSSLFLLHILVLRRETILTMSDRVARPFRSSAYVLIPTFVIFIYFSLSLSPSGFIFSRFSIKTLYYIYIYIYQFFNAFIIVKNRLVYRNIYIFKE